MKIAVALWCLWTLAPTLSLCAPLEGIRTDPAPPEDEAEALPADPQALVLVPYHMHQQLQDLPSFNLPTGQCSPTTQQLIPTNALSGVPLPLNGTFGSTPTWWVWVLYCNPVPSTAKPEEVATTSLPFAAPATEVSEPPALEAAYLPDPEPKYLTDATEASIRLETVTDAPFEVESTIEVPGEPTTEAPDQVEAITEAPNQVETNAEAPVQVEATAEVLPESPDTTEPPAPAETTATSTESLPGPAEALDPTSPDPISEPVTTEAPAPVQPEHTAPETATEEVVVLPVEGGQIPPPPIESFIYNTTVPSQEIVVIVPIPHDPCLTNERTTTTQSPVDPCATPATPAELEKPEQPEAPVTGLTTESPRVVIPEPTPAVELITVAVTTPEPESSLLPAVCGIANITGNQVVDGKDTPQRAWPWMAVLLYRNRRSGRITPACGGVLITDQHVLTAAHCCCLKNQLVQVRLGDHHGDDAEAVQVVAIASIISHERYNVWPHGNDIAILKLEQKIRITEKVQPICLPANAEFRPEDLVSSKPFVAGWADGSEEWYALLEERKASTDVQLPVISLSECEQSYKRNPIYKNYVFNSSVICTAYPDGGQDACQVDSGRPLMLPFGASNRFHLLGVVTWGHGCGEPGYPGVYTSVPNYVDWILTNLS